MKSTTDTQLDKPVLSCLLRMELSVQTHFSSPLSSSSRTHFLYKHHPTIKPRRLLFKSSTNSSSIQIFHLNKSCSTTAFKQQNKTLFIRVCFYPFNYTWVWFLFLKLILKCWSNQLYPYICSHLLLLYISVHV